MSILIADSGSTKTDWMFIDDEGNLQHHKTIGFNPYFQSSETILNELRNNLLPALHQSHSPLKNIYYYGTGCSTKTKIEIVKQSLLQAFGNITVEVNHDLLAAARALCGNETGIACILGTGSNSCLYNGSEITENVPSVGYLFGDHGSGATIGRTFVQHYFDGLLPLHLMKNFEEAGFNREVILENVYKKSMPSRYLAAVVGFIKDYPMDDFIKNLIKKCFTDFFIFQVSKYTNAKNLPINFVGSIAFYFCEILKEVCSELGFKMGLTIKSPIEGLAMFHAK